MIAVVKYAREGGAKYIAHLDMQRAFVRALRRSGIPLLFSQGFHPHPLISFASPLSVGYATRGDYFEVAISESISPDEFVRRINAHLPDEIRVLHMHEKSSGKKLMAANHSAEYAISFYGLTQEEKERLKNAVSCIVTSESRIAKNNRGKETDIRPLILSLCADGGTVKAALQNSSAGALNPIAVVNALLSEADIKADHGIERRECYAKTEGNIIPFSEI